VGATCEIPDDADVANALGAVVGQVRVSAEVTVTQPQPGLFRLSGNDGRDFASEEEALAVARDRAAAEARAGAMQAGADETETETATETRTATVDGQRLFVEARVAATASGRPRLAN
jgi:N-methylhydantoinase A/oxoprolinase/acetone carboxylase beta subunit